MKEKKGFTLVELLIVISVISMLASIVMVQISLAQAKSRDTARTQQIRQIDLGTQLYVELNKKTPPLYTTGCELLSESAVSWDEASACLAVSTAGIGTDQYENWRELKSQLNDFIHVPDDPCKEICAPANPNFPVGYIYVPPRAMQYYCSQSGTCTATADSYQLYAALERQVTPQGNHGSTDKYFSPVSSYFTLTISAGGVDISVSGQSTCTKDDGECEYDIQKDSEVTLTATTNINGNISWIPPCNESGTTSGSTCTFQMNQSIFTGASVSEEPPLPPAPSLSAPTGLTTTFNANGSITFRWLIPESTYGFPDNSSYTYHIYKEGSEEPRRTVPDSLQTTFSGSSATWWGSSFCWKMKAVDLGGHESEFSQVTCAP